MEQKVPDIDIEDIRRIVKRDFSQSEFTKIESILSQYNSESSKGRYRVYASILKLSSGNIELLDKYIFKKAIDDYRNVIALAEYPNYTDHAFDDQLSLEMERQLISDDWQQYEAWFHKNRI